MAQHIDIAVCAHVSCWAILRYYSETFPQVFGERIVAVTSTVVCRSSAGSTVRATSLPDTAPELSQRRQLYVRGPTGSRPAHADDTGAPRTREWCRP